MAIKQCFPLTIQQGLNQYFSQSCSKQHNFLHQQEPPLNLFHGTFQESYLCFCVTIQAILGSRDKNGIFNKNARIYTSAKLVCNDKKYQNGSNSVFFSDRTHGKLEKMLNFLCGLGVVPIENNVKLPV